MAQKRKPKAQLKISKNEAIEILWRKGNLQFKLNSAQRKLYETFHNTKSRIPVFNQSRRTGKSFTLLVMALEHCLANSNVTVHYVCGTSVMATKIINQNMPEIIKDCPAELRPRYFKHDRAFTFKNGSKLQIEGADEGNAERLRGTSTHLGIIDEAGFIKDLEYLVNDILLPQILTTNGKLLLSSTPPKTAEHAFFRFVEKAKLEDAYIKQTIVDVLDLIKNDPAHLRSHLNPKIVEEIKISVGGEDSLTWRREFMAEFITDSTSVVIPEFTDKLEAEVVRTSNKPSYYDPYTVMDPGLVDNTGILFAYLDFHQAQLVIEDELLLNGNEVTTQNIATYIRNKENSLWVNIDGEARPVYMRFSDNEPILLNDLRQLHNLNFIPTKKDNKEAAINDLRIRIANKQIIINPKCKNLIFQLKTATWSGNRKGFSRSTEGGHYDLVDALIYLVRMVNWGKNPFPYQGHDPDNMFFRSSKNPLSNQALAIKSIFTKKK